MKKYFEIAKINSQIRNINREINMDTRRPVVLSGHLYSPIDSPSQFRESEKVTVLREALNNLFDEREALRKK